MHVQLNSNLWTLRNSLKNNLSLSLSLSFSLSLSIHFFSSFTSFVCCDILFAWFDSLFSYYFPCNFETLGSPPGPLLQIMHHAFVENLFIVLPFFFLRFIFSFSFVYFPFYLCFLCARVCGCVSWLIKKSNQHVICLCSPRILRRIIKECLKIPSHPKSLKWIHLWWVSIRW